MNALLLTVPQAAETLAVSRRTVYTLIDNGSLEAVHIGRAVRIPAQVIDEYVSALREDQ